MFRYSDHIISLQSLESAGDPVFFQFVQPFPVFILLECYGRVYVSSLIPGTGFVFFPDNIFYPGRSFIFI